LRFVVQEAVPLRNRLVLRLNPRELAEKIESQKAANAPKPTGSIDQPGPPK